MRKEALSQMLVFWGGVWDITDWEISDKEWTIIDVNDKCEEDYVVYTEQESKDAAVEYIMESFEDYHHELHERLCKAHALDFFDLKGFAEDTVRDCGVCEVLSHHDGEEHTTRINGIRYVAYRLS